MSAPHLKFLRTLFDGEDGYLDLRAIVNRDVRTQFVAVGDLAAVDRFIAQHGAGRNIYVGVATRATNANGTGANCRRLRLLFVNLDFKDIPENEARRRLGAFPLRPSLVVATGGGLHVYWLLAEPIDLMGGTGFADAKVMLRRLAETLGGDTASAEPARVLRIPGTKNIKYDPPRDVAIERLDSTVSYAWREFVMALHASDRVSSSAAAPASGDPFPAGQRNSRLMAVAGSLRRQGLDEAAIGAALLSINRSRCRPPLDDAEVQSIARGVERYAPATDIANYPLTEAGDAEFFAATAGDRVRFDHRRGRWLVFGEHRWVPDDDGALHRLAIDAIRRRQAEAMSVGNSDERARAVKWAIAGESRNRLNNMLALAKAIKPVSDSGDAWDTDPMLLGVPNGVVDLVTGMLRSGQPGDRITLAARAAFDPHAMCPLWDRTVAAIFGDDVELIRFFDRFIGYSLTGDCREEALALCWGGGANGKGTVMNTTAWVLGDYADDLPFSALELDSRSSIPNDLAKLVGKRFVTSSESGEARRLNEARVKALTGRDPITARFLHREFFTFQPDAKFWLATNSKPVVRDTSVGFWRRMRLIPFLQSFADRPDLTLKDRLRAESAGILARAVRGCLAWQHEGLAAPVMVTAATRRYQEDSDPIAPFIEERCVVMTGATVRAGELYKAYLAWCVGRVRDAERLSQTKFGERIKTRFEDDEDRKGVKYLGVGLREPEREERTPF